jgi:hypothetical protein
MIFQDLQKIKQKLLDCSELDGFPATACRVWTRGRSNGYGQIWAGNKTYSAHRVAFALANGWLPSSTQNVLHKCNNKRCIRVDHLYCGSAKENHADAVRAGVDYTKGRRKITDLQASQILWLALNCPYLTYDEIGQRYNTTKSSVWQIKHGVTIRLSKVTPIKPSDCWWDHSVEGFKRKV